MPVDAVIHDGKGAHVWVETAAGKFEPRMVETGGENALWIEITSGVQPGEVVVTDGAYLLSSEFILKKEQARCMTINGAGAPALFPL
ncbi:hypothetical protein KRR40_05470 [Niabella defluvii]|nr:hypothetical protein KRR40_05470 [Niabella sp. I65]